jgi:hypothetical protein
LNYQYCSFYADTNYYSYNGSNTRKTKVNRQFLASLKSAAVASKLGAIIKEAEEAITELLKVINTCIFDLSTSVLVLHNKFQTRGATMAT